MCKAFKEMAKSTQQNDGGGGLTLSQKAHCKKETNQRQ